MEGHSKSRFPEKCKNCIWGRFPSKCWCNFQALLLPKCIFYKKTSLGNQSKKKNPPNLKWRRGRTIDKPDGSPKAPPRARTFQTRNTCLSNCWALFWICCENKLSRCNKSEMVDENSKVRSTWWRCYQKLIKTCWKRCSNYWNKCYYSESMKLLKKWQQVLERTVPVIWHPLGKGPANLFWFPMFFIIFCSFQTWDRKYSGPLSLDKIDH